MAIPLAMYGPDIKMAESIGAALEPDYEIVTICLDKDSAERCIPSECAGNFDGSSSHGTNASATTKKAPKAVIVAANVSDSDEKNLAKLVQQKAASVPVIKATKFDVIKAGGMGPDPVVIAKVFRKKLNKEGL